VNAASVPQGIGARRRTALLGSSFGTGVEDLSANWHDEIGPLSVLAFQSPEPVNLACFLRLNPRQVVRFFITKRLEQIQELWMYSRGMIVSDKPQVVVQTAETTL